MRSVILKQMVVWLFASVLAIPPLQIFVEDIYATVRYRGVGIPLFSLYEIDFSSSFLPWACTSLIVVAMIAILLFAWPAANRIWLIVPLTVAATFFVVWLLWSVTSVIPFEDTDAFALRVLFGELVGFLCSRVFIRPKRDSIGT